MRNLILAFFTVCLFTAPLFSQSTIPSGSAVNQGVANGHTDNDLFFYIGLNQNTMHIVWEELDAPIEYYSVQQSTDGINFITLDSISQGNHFDIFANDYPEDVNYDNTILYSTETGNGRFIYNDVLTSSEMLQLVLWYRVKMVTAQGNIIYTKRMDKVMNSSGFSKPSGQVPVQNHNNPLVPAQLNGLPPIGNFSPLPDNERRIGCPTVQTPPSGYVFTGNSVTYYGDCCYWEEREYQQSLITAPCGAYNAWCCAFDCSPLAYDPCCVHICSEYNRCSCHPWTCCNVSNGTIWIVYSSTTYTLGASITDQTNVDCYGNGNGSVTINTTGGFAPLQYSWDNGVSTGNNFTGLQPGIYSLSVTDAKGCQETLNFTITQPPVLTSSLSKVDVTCFGFNNGSMDLSVNGGTPGYTYSWSNSATTQDLNGIGPGNYAVTVSDQHGCSVSESNAIFSPDLFTGIITATDASCFGTNSGSAILALTGGTPPNTIVWSNGETANLNDNLGIGTYSVSATDANGCTFADTFTIGQPTEIFLSSTSTNSTCGQCNGEATVSATGGSGSYLFQWPPTANNQQSATATALCAGSYTVLVSDANATTCFKTITVSISNVGAETISTSKTDASCFGACDGSAAATYSCADAPCTIKWYNPQGDSIAAGVNSLSNLCAGSYSVVVTNASGCDVAQTVDILQPSRIQANLNIVNETCSGACNGIAAAAPTGGVSPYTFLWKDTGGNTIGSNVNLLNNLCSGNYTLDITDNTGCSATFPFTINVTSAVTATISVVDNLCFGECNGSITAVPSGGTAPYTFQWFDNGDPIPNATTNSLVNLCAGRFTVQITGSNGCSFTSSNIFINQPLEILATLTTSDITCTGSCNGSATVNAIGGTGTFQYKWYNNFSVLIPTETNPAISNLCAGNYFWEVVDTNGCSTGITPFTINDQNPLVATFAVSNVSCNGAGDGAIDLTVSGGNPPYVYSWNNGASTSEDLTSIGAGTYTVEITDSSGCSITKTADVTEPDAIQAPITVRTYGSGGYHVSCFGSSNGQLTVNPTGGVAPYTYQWNDSAGQQAFSAIGLALGTYTVTVTDANGCTATNSATLSLEPAPMTSSVTAITYNGGYNVSCNGASDGEIDLTVTGGEPPFVYNWNDDAYLIEDPTGVPAGLYTVNVVDTALGCIIRDTILLTEPSALQLTFTPSVYPGGVNVSTMGGSDGSIDLEVSGGVQPYSYNWSNGDTAQDLSGLSAGTYTCTVTDGNNCVVIGSITLREPAPTFEVIDTTICEGGSVFAGGALQTTSGTYTDSLLNIFGLDSITVTNLTVLPNSTTHLQITICQGQSVFAGGADQTQTGTYYDTLPAANGCDSIVVTDLIVTSDITLSFSIVDAGCDGTCDGSATVNATGGTLPYTYVWSNNATTQDINQLCAGNYDVTVTDADGCQGTGSTTIAGGQPISVNISRTNNSCICSNLISNYDICVIDFAGLPNGTLLNEQYAASGIHISGTSYNGGYGQLIIFDSYSTGTQDRDLQVEIGNLAIIPENLIDGNGDGLVDAPNDHSGGGQQIYTFDEDRTVVSFVFVDKDNTQPATATAYDEFNQVITTVNIPFAGDGSVQTIMVNASGVRKFVIDYHDSGAVTEITLGCEHHCCDGSATANAVGGTAPFSYIWSTGATSQDIDSLCAGSYSVTITDANGCSGTESVNITDYVEMELSASHTDVTENCFDSTTLCILNFSSYPAGTILDEQYASYGIHISSVAHNGGINKVIVFNSNAVNTPDPDLQAGIGNLAIIPENITDANGDGLVDAPNDYHAGGQQIYLFDEPRTVVSFVFVDMDRPTAGNAIAYDEFNNLLATVPILNMGDGSVQTVVMNTSGVRKLVIDYKYDSGGITELVLDCDMSCCDGTASVAVTGGEGPYTFAWSDGSTSQTADSLCQGTYTVTVTDAYGCEETATVIISIPPPPAAKLLSGISSSNERSFEVKVYPIPFNDLFILDVYSTEARKGNFRLMDILGRTVMESDMELNSGSNQKVIPVGSEYASGIYFLEFKSADHIEFIKLQKTSLK